MADGSLARRYATAMVSLAEEASSVDAVERDLLAFDEVLSLGGNLLRSSLNNPGLTTEERRAVLDAVLSQVHVHAYVANLLRLLADKNRFAAYSGICKAYVALADELAGRVRATVTTARPIGVLLQAHVEKALRDATGSKVIVTYVTDAALLGGMVAQVGDKVYDASVRARLEALQESLSSGATGLEA